MTHKPIKIKRLNESHETLPENFLSMTIGEVLDGLEAEDTDKDSAYEMVEGIFLALRDQIMGGGGYEGDRDMSDVEKVEGGDEISFGDSEGDEGYREMPDFSEIDGEDQSQGGNELDNFNF